MSLGIGYDKKYTYDEIAILLGWARSTILRIINGEKYKLKEYIALNYPKLFPSFLEEVKKVVFKSLEERDKYIFESYYGIGVKKKSDKVICEECGFLRGFAKIIASNYKKSLPTEERKKLNRSNKASKELASMSDDKMNLF